MIRLKFDILELLLALIVGFVLGIIIKKEVAEWKPNDVQNVGKPNHSAISTLDLTDQVAAEANVRSANTKTSIKVERYQKRNSQLITNSTTHKRWDESQSHCSVNDVVERSHCKDTIPTTASPYKLNGSANNVIISPTKKKQRNAFHSPSSEASSGSLGAGFFGAVAQLDRAYWLMPETSGVEGMPYQLIRPQVRFLPALFENLAQGGWASKPTENGALERAKPPTFTIIVTAYCGKSCCCGEFTDGITASGHIIEPNDCFVAAPPEIPFGTPFLIEGYSDEPVRVLDRGSAIQGNRLDVYFDSHDEALAWGVREFEVER